MINKKSVLVLLIAMFLAVMMVTAASAASTKVTKNFPSSGETSFVFKVTLPKDCKMLSTSGKTWKTYYSGVKSGGKAVVTKSKSGSTYYIKFNWYGYVGKGVNMHMNVKYTYKDKNGLKHTIKGGLSENKKKWIKGYES